MSIIDIKMKKIYGLNKYDDDLIFKSDVKHNFIYGINAIGKTSFSKGIELLIENKQYKKLMDADSNEYSINFKFDNINESMDNISVFNHNNEDLNKSLFVFTKRYLNQHISLVNSDNSNIQIGIRIAEREKYIYEVDQIIDNFQKNIFESIKSANLKTTKDGFTSDSNIIKLKSTLKDKAKERYQKQLAYESLINSFDKLGEINDYTLNTGDFNGNNLEKFRDIKDVLEKLIEKVDEIIEKNFDTDLYKIENISDKDFYHYAVEYLKSKQNLTLCPICKKNEFDLDSVVEQIDAALTNLLKDEIILEFDKSYSELEKDNNSNIYININKIYDNLLKNEVDINLINDTISMINDLIDNYDLYLIKFINCDTTHLVNNDYESKIALIKEINEQNSEYSENDLFIDDLNKMLNYIFENDELQAQKYKYNESGNEYYGIQLIVNGIMKKGISIEDFWSEILSESQKTKISLAFLFSVVIFNNYNGKILCIFDDPVDSYDSYNKYKMSRFIYEFITKKGLFKNYNYDCYDLIFSHSVEYLRLFNENINKSDENDVLYWIMSSNNICEIKKQNLFLLRGDFNILNHMIYESQHNQLQIKINEFISVTPIIRELSSISKKAFDNNTRKLKIGNNEIYKLDEFISENVIHGYSKEFLVKDLINEITDYINITIDRQYDNIKLFDYIKNFIDENIENYIDMDFYEQIFFKNLLAIYVRSKYDHELCLAIKQHVPKYRNKNLNEIHSENREISKKVSILYKDENVRNQNMSLLVKVSKAKPMLNDFAHSANIFLTPLIDVTLNELKNIYNEI